MYLPLVPLTAMLSPRNVSLLYHHLYPQLISNEQWDLRLFSPGPPPCDPTSPNIELSVFHRAGLYGRNCTALDDALNTQTVASLSWKSPTEDEYDLCMFTDAECACEPVDRIASGWEVCYPYSGWRAFVVVEKGGSCIG